jgi:hypothetical protein
VEFTVLERSVRVECEGPLADDLAAAALAAYADLDVRRPDEAAEPPTGRLALDTSDRDLPGLLEELSQLLCQWGIQERRGELLMLHACGVADPASGGAVAFVGPSGAGKSTAAWTLGAEWGYLGDEVVALRDDGSIVPLRKPVSLIVDSQPAKAQVPAVELGLRPAPVRPHLAGLVLLDRRPGADLSVEPVATIDALPLLAPQCSYLGAHDRPLHRLAAAAGTGGGVLRATYSDAQQLSPLVGELVAGGGR